MFGSDEDTFCTDADSCNDSGQCVANDLAPGSVCGSPGGVCFSADVCDAGVCEPGSVMATCSVTGTVIGQGDPLVGVTVEIVGADNATVTDDNGEFSMTIPIETEVLMYVHETTGFFGSIGYTVFSRDAGDNGINLSLETDGAIVSAAEGLPTPADVGKAVVTVGMEGENYEGDESAQLSADSSTAIIEISSDVYIESTSIMSTDGGNMTFYDVVGDSTTVSVDPGSNGSCQTHPAGMSSWPIAPHTVTTVRATCQ